MGMSQVWWYTPVTPVLERQRQMEPWNFKASMVYTSNFRIARATQ